MDFLGFSVQPVKASEIALISIRSLQNLFSVWLQDLIALLNATCVTWNEHLPEREASLKQQSGDIVAGRNISCRSPIIPIPFFK